MVPDAGFSEWGDDAMKTTLMVVCLFFSTAAFAQYSSLGSSRNNEPVIPSTPEHPAHAGYSYMSSGQSVLAGASYSSAQGERPASDFPQPDQISLGTAARELKKQHETKKKSKVVWIN
jgi:hypothetical protein